MLDENNLFSDGNTHTTNMDQVLSNLGGAGCEHKCLLCNQDKPEDIYRDPNGMVSYLPACHPRVDFLPLKKPKK